MPKTFDQQLQTFVEKQKKRIADVRAEVVEYTMDRLFAHSPHFAEAKYAEGVYDASHKISINGSPTGGAEGPTRSRAASRMIIEKEIVKVDKIKAGDTVVISNESDHARDVEYGKLESASWKNHGYAPFQSARNDVKLRYKNVIK